jgi:hypothetical protein
MSASTTHSDERSAARQAMRSQLLLQEGRPDLIVFILTCVCAVCDCLRSVFIQQPIFNSCVPHWEGTGDTRTVQSKIHDTVNTLWQCETYEDFMTHTKFIYVVFILCYRYIQ